MYTKLTDIRRKIAAKCKNEMTVLEVKLDTIAEKLGFDLAKESTKSLFGEYSCGFKEGMGFIYSKKDGGPWGLVDSEYGAAALKFAYLCHQVESQYDSEHAERHPRMHGAWKEILSEEDSAVLQSIEDALKPHFISSGMDIAGMVFRYRNLYLKADSIAKDVLGIEEYLRRDGILEAHECFHPDIKGFAELEELKSKCTEILREVPADARRLRCNLVHEKVVADSRAALIKEAIESESKVGSRIGELEEGIAKQVQEMVDMLNERERC